MRTRSETEIKMQTWTKEDLHGVFVVQLSEVVLHQAEGATTIDSTLVQARRESCNVCGDGSERASYRGAGL